MPESNIANTQLIYGRTNYINVTTNWQVLVINPTGSEQVFKINSLFVANKSVDSIVDVDVRMGRVINGVNIYFQLTKNLAIPLDATLIAICRDNPVYLQEGDFIQVRAGAANRADATASFEIIAATVGSVPTLTVPSIPTAVVAEPGNASATIYWSAPTASGGTDILDYTIQLAERETANSSWSAFTTISKPESPLRSFTASGLTNDRQYKFRVAALNAIGLGDWSVESNTISPTPQTAMTPPAASGYDAAAVVRWEAYKYSTAVVSGYVLRWSADDGQTWLPTAAGAPTNSALLEKTIYGLQNDTQYVFSVRAVTDFGISPWSPISAAATPSAVNGPPPVNAANYNAVANWGSVTSGGTVTTVGSAQSPTYYGAYDMIGNVNQYLESRAGTQTSASDVFALGGSFATTIPAGAAAPIQLRSDYLGAGPGSSASNDSGQYYPVDPDEDGVPRVPDIGFRLVSFAESPLVKHNNSFVPVGDPNNPAGAVDLSTSIFAWPAIGSVDTAYSIQQYPVSNAEYAEFLNAVDAAGSNANNIYSPLMGSNNRGGITFTAENAAGAKYAVKPNMGNKPVNFVSWYSCIRYANWMHNGCPTTGTQTAATTEDGAYQFAPGGRNSASPEADFTNYAVYPTYPYYHVRKANAQYVLPTADEWYKAAYYDPTRNDGAPGYWLYATQSDTAPLPITANEQGDGVL